jgi:hypothetical protein
MASFAFGSWRIQLPVLHCTLLQVAFMDIVVLPLMQALASAFPGTEASLQGVRHSCCTCNA